MNINQFLTDKQVAARYSVGRATVWRWIKDNQFPKPVKLGPGATRWRLSDVQKWEATK